MDTNVDQIVKSLDDGNATRILTTSVRHHVGAGEAETELATEAQEALRASFQIERGRDPVSDGDIAREALSILAQDPQVGERIAVLAQSPPTQHFGIDPVTSAILTTAVIMVLKTQVEFSRNTRGEWSIRIKSNALDKELLKGFVEKLLSWMPSNPFGYRQPKS